MLDAPLSERPYKPAYPLGKAMEYIDSQTSKHFDPSLNSVLHEVVRVREAFADERGAMTELQVDESAS